MKTSRSILESWFQTGMYPTQQQFWNWLDSFFHLDDPIPTSSVTGLDIILADKATVEETASLQTQINNISTGNAPVTNVYTANSSFTIPDGKILEKIVVISDTAMANFGVGSATNGYDIMPAVAIGINDAELFDLNIYSNGGQTIWFNGIAGKVTVKIYMR